jgi:hypothetical protein
MSGENIPEPMDEPVESLLDWHFRADAGLSRLRRRLRSEKKRPAVVLKFARRFAAVAALLLITWGLVGGLSPLSGPGLVPSSDVVATLQRDSGLPDHAVVKAFNLEKLMPGRGTEEAAFKTFTFQEGDPPSRRQRGDKVPPGPRVELLLEVHNRGQRPLELKVGGQRTRLRLDLEGPGTQTLLGVKMADGQLPPFLSERSIQLQPGSSYFLPIPYLVGGQRGELQGVYWTAPGRYRLTVHYRVGAMDGSAERDLVVDSPPTTIEVKPR